MSKICGLGLVRRFGLYYFPGSGIPDENAVLAMNGSRLLNALVRNLRIDVTGPRQLGKVAIDPGKAIEPRSDPGFARGSSSGI